MKARLLAAALSISLAGYSAIARAEDDETQVTTDPTLAPEATSAPTQEAPVATPAPPDEAFLSLPSADVEVPAAKFGVGEPIRCKVNGLSLEGITDPSRELKVEQAGATPSDPLDSGWKVVPVSPPADAKKKGPGALEFDLVLLKPGRLEIPSLAIRAADGKALARTNPFGVEAASSLDRSDPKASEAEDIRDPIKLLLPKWVLVLGALLIAGALGIAISWAMQKIREARERRARVPEVPKTEDEVALIELVELEKKGFWRQDAFKKHYFGVSEILKKYFTARYAFDALECTTEELLYAFDLRSDVHRPIVDRVRVLFVDKLDPVKFADRIPPQGEPEAILSEARRIVRETAKPKTVIVPGVPGAPTQFTGGVAPSGGPGAPGVPGARK